LTFISIFGEIQNMSMIFKALSDSTRRSVLELLRKGPMSAGELAEPFNVAKSTMSAHFAVLREAGLVVSEKRGQSVVYELQLSVLEDALLGFAKAFGWKLEDEKAMKPRQSDSKVLK
jgi:DNA-binding transcriptional ArsR family regulator